MGKTDKLICPICGAPTRVYMGNARKDRLCSKHADELKQGLIAQCDKCEKWHSAQIACNCKKDNQYAELPTRGFYECILCGEETYGYAFCRDCWADYTNEELLNILNNKKVSKGKNTESKNEDAVSKVKDTVPKNENTVPKNNSEEQKEAHEEQVNENNVIVINENGKSRCITCGIKTDGLLFCSSCYHKYKNKELLFKITNCTNVELLDENYEGRYTCKDGHVVKSKSERDIDNYLFENGIPHGYEKELPYGATEKETLHPDFYLPHFLGKGRHVYIEHWGYNENNIQYTRTKKFKMPIYKKLCDDKEITLICTYEKSDMGKIDSVLDRKLNISFIKENEINFEE